MSVDNIAEKAIMANVSTLIFGAAIAVASISTPALAAHKTTPISAHRHGYLTRRIYDLAPAYGRRARSYNPYDSGISDPEGEPGGSGG
jgi:hypothetical protein